MKALMILVVSSLILGCGISIDGGEPLPAQLKLYLTDAPNDNLTEVVVNVKHVEVWLAGQGKEGRLIVAEGLGPIDLLQLQNGLLLPLSNVMVPSMIQVKQFRILLEEEGHYATRDDATQCELKTPSAQNSGIKLIVPGGISLAPAMGYSLVVDFDAKKSVVQQGNGNCLLKPVLKLKAAVEHEQDDDINGSLGEIPEGEDVVTEDELPSSDEDPNYTDGFDYSDPSTWPPGYTEEDIINMF